MISIFFRVRVPGLDGPNRTITHAGCALRRCRASNANANRGSDCPGRNRTERIRNARPVARADRKATGFRGNLGEDQHQSRPRTGPDTAFVNHADSAGNLPVADREMGVRYGKLQALGAGLDADSAVLRHRGESVQTLLAERFHLTAHHEMTDMPVTALLVAKGGPKVRASAGKYQPELGPEAPVRFLGYDDNVHVQRSQDPDGRIHNSFSNVSMPLFAAMLELMASRSPMDKVAVVDMTG